MPGEFLHYLVHQSLKVCNYKEQGLIISRGGSAMLGVLITIWLLDLTSNRIKTWHEPKAIQLLGGMVIVLISTLSMVIQSFITLAQVNVGIVEFPKAPPALVISRDIESFCCGLILILLYYNEICLGDIVICWRAWVLLPHDKFWRFGLGAIMASSIGVGIADGVYDAVSSIDIIGSTLDGIATGLSLLVNMTATGLIAWKAWANYRTMNEALTSRKSRVHKILLLLVESGAFFLIIQLFSLIGIVLLIANSTTTDLTIPFIAQTSYNLFSAFAGLYPIVIIVLVHSDSNTSVVEAL
ncbi:hypothetical protein BDP27DRAFT_1373427 [Rhodocollybia butyracea]|uniref:Uncharacterized protein n=1 Tax=Rhodocollybia butyracea TaxID=206335 RepID=A0A9P5P980_9AGAR|nr:hypothetical protein BDP27DRAFT_1373427 [Rhodocollybia butyracea]